jgi:hypothetical protein
MEVISWARPIVSQNSFAAAQAMMVRRRSAKERNIKAPGRRLHVSLLALSIANRPLAFPSHPPFRQRMNRVKMCRSNFKRSKNKHCVIFGCTYLKFALRRECHLGSKVTRVAVYSVQYIKYLCVCGEGPRRSDPLTSPSMA